MYDPEDVDISEIWGKSATLYAARHHYGRFFFGEDWTMAQKQAEKKHPIQAISDAIQLSQDQGVTFQKALAQTSGEITKLSEPFERMCQKAQSEIKKDIRNGRLVATAHEVDRRLSSRPHFVPLDLWEGYISWTSGTLKKGKLKAIEVRLIEASKMPGVVAELIEIQAPPEEKHIGRPSFEDAISAAINSLMETCRIDTDKSQAWHYPLIRLELEHPRYNLDKPPQDIHDETIRRYFSPIFKELKKTKKQ